MTNGGVTDSDLRARQERLLELHRAVLGAREAIAPHEANLAAVQREYQGAIGPLQRQLFQLREKVAKLREASAADDGAIDTAGFMRSRSAAEPKSVSVTHDYSESVEKDELLEYLSDVLDPIHQEQAKLFGTIQGICETPGSKLAEALEKLLPCVHVWKTPAAGEDLTAQMRRHDAWIAALERQLASLNESAERLKNDPRSKLWEKFGEGEEAWRDFLRQGVARLRRDVDELEAELNELEQPKFGANRYEP